MAVNKQLAIMNRWGEALQELSRKVNAGELTPDEGMKQAYEVCDNYGKELMAASPAE